MAFNLENKFLYGDGELGDVEISEGAVQDFNSYAAITAFDSNTVTININTMIEGKYNTFRAGTDIFIFCAATNRETAEFLGLYTFANITLVNNGVLTLDKNVAEIFGGVNLDFEYLQAVTVPNFNCLKLHKGAVVTCPPYNPFNHVGGVLIIRCWQDLIFDGGNIVLTDCGIPANRKNALRPLTMQETPANGLTDKAKLSGQENFITAERFLLNAGDGAAIIFAKNLVCNEDSRIGNPSTHGAQFCRGAADSAGVKPSNITNVGGTSILLAAETIQNFTPKILAKYRSVDKPEGRGLCRCYIASNTKLRTDEGLYAYDTISNPARVRDLGIENFGNGTFGDCVNPAAPLNNYAAVAEISQGGYKFRMTGNTLTGMILFNADALIMVLAVQKSTKYTDDAGKFVIGRIIKREGNYVTINKKIPFDTGKYFVQAVTIPEFNNLTINQNYTATPKFDGRKGGVFAVAVAENFNLADGKLNVEGKGGAAPYGRAGLATIGNAQNSDKLPIGEGHGSIFILAKNLICNENSRIGAMYSGAGTGGRLGGNNATGTNQGGGYSGAPDEDKQGSGGGYIGGGAGNSTNTGGLGGSGFAGGTESGLEEFNASAVTGGYGSNGKAAANFAGGRQGAHVFIAADNVTGLTVANISTGGEGGKGTVNGVAGAASYGGGGSQGGSSGGSGGFAFIYTNNF